MGSWLSLSGRLAMSLDQINRRKLERVLKWTKQSSSSIHTKNIL